MARVGCEPCAQLNRLANIPAGNLPAIGGRVLGQEMTRDQFREAVFARDKYQCVSCGFPGPDPVPFRHISTGAVDGNSRLDAHHIMERRLWPDGGYYLANGATLCGPCHLRAEQTLIRPQWLWATIGVSPLLPPHLYTDQEYDKWGNPYIAIDRRMPGELFDDESVQKVLAPVLHEFCSRVKYPRTYHLPWSPGLTSDDRVMEDVSQLEGHDIVVTVKMDGEQTTIYPDGYCHARSIDSGSHPSRDWVKALAGRVGPQLPPNWRICGENLWAKHSLLYTNLPAPFLMFSIWDGLTCLSWEDTELWAALLGLHTVQRLSSVPLKDMAAGVRPFPFNVDTDEGYVVRRAEAFHYREFRQKVGKWVRASHVHTHGHWMREQIVRNGIAKSMVIWTN